MAIAASTAWAGPATAAEREGAQTLRAAAFEPLTERSARRFAVRLARSVARERKVVAWHLSDAAKVRRTRIVFIYDDRNADNVFCVAKIVVEQTARTRSVTLGGGRCRVVPDEALAIEKATRALVRAVRGQVPEIRRSVEAYETEVVDCEGIVVPRGRQPEVESLFEAGELIAVFSPIRAQLEGFVTALQNAQPEDRELARGVVGWTRFLGVVTALPAEAADSCTAHRRWAANSYAPEAAPVDFAALAEQLGSIDRQVRTIARASERLLELGVFPTAGVGFNPFLLETVL
jgi:hypothetical protein